MVKFSAAAFALISLLTGAPAAHAEGATAFSFGLWGDLPYAKNGDLPKMTPLINHLNAADIAFSIFDGDTKDGSSECSDASFAETATLFNRLKAPMIYVPGDNEWTDCHRLNNGSYDNLERLAYLRKTMFATDQSFGQNRLSFTQQGKPSEKFAENTRFVYGGIIFVGLNIPGSNNNKVTDKDCLHKLSARTPAQCEADNAEYEERDAANIAWMGEAFKIARDSNAEGIVLTFQADPGFDRPETWNVNERNAAEFGGYTRFLNALMDEARAYKGQVLVVHGDTHFFTYDKPFLDQAHLIPNITRLETFGSPNAHWVKVTVEPGSTDVFVIRQMIVPGN